MRKRVPLQGRELEKSSFSREVGETKKRVPAFHRAAHRCCKRMRVDCGHFAEKARGLSLGLFSCCAA
ncbi:hypothetical protein GEOBRER4_n3102 [Citrifermentans bremense]|uniref:Uncharacterized protein n=2 Tax=Geobacteraceae TaxID=213422 RepID=A0ABQ0ME58_9BACT|nr:hypothetical protein GEOBRER4_n3102 [Citrifermentans bremense]GAW65392.1 hypothetical protein GPEL0_01f0250 [Geoanaerobacter pelophilus]